MKRIALIGSTGSIGTQVLNVVKRHSDKFCITAMTAHSSYKLFEKQINQFKPEYAVLSDCDAAKQVREIPDGCSFYAGEDNAVKAACYDSADVVFVAVSGFAGLKYSLAAIKAGKKIALANKETLVCGGDLIMRSIEDSTGLIPVDSEHSAIWQCLNFNPCAKLKSLIITASGGAFRGRDWDSLKDVTPQQALNHPTWQMGAKITVDSATLLNKGFEVIEAHHLYGTPYSEIKTVIHPSSIVHSMVQFDDGAILAQLSNPTMELPIQLALTYPERLDCNVKPLDFSQAFSLDFQPLVRTKYPCYDLALKAGEAGGIMPCAMNAAGEVAVQAFLSGQTSFTSIASVIDGVLQQTAIAPILCFDELCEVDKKSRLAAKELIKKL